MAARYRVEKTTAMDGSATFHVLDDEIGSRPIAEFDSEEAAEIHRRELEEGFREIDAQVPDVESAPRNNADQ